jgi:hypothetical protein
LATNQCTKPHGNIHAELEKLYCYGGPSTYYAAQHRVVTATTAHAHMPLCYGVITHKQRSASWPFLQSGLNGTSCFTGESQLLHTQ